MLSILPLGGYLCGEGFGGEDVVEVDLGIWIQDGDVLGQDRVFGWGEGARRGVIRVRNSVYVVELLGAGRDV